MWAWLAGSPATADAGAHFERGVALSSRGDYPAALTEFQTAYRLAPAYEVLFNLGVVHEKLSEPVLALQAFERYLAEGKTAVPRDRHKLVDQEISSLRKQCSELVIQVDGAPATVEVDGIESGDTPLTTRIYVLPGRHRVVVRRGDEAAQADVDSHRGDRVVVALSLARPRGREPDSDAPRDARPLEPIVAPPAKVELPTVTAAPVAPPAWYRRWYVWVGIGVIAAGVAATVAVVETRPRVEVRTDVP
jgi:tetratricopeptide (TPR) repeat protein